LGLALVAVLIGAGIGSNANLPEPGGPAPSSTEHQTLEADPVGPDSPFPVHVSGWVAMPGVVELGEGSIVADAVAAAGGALEGALLDSVNLAAPVQAGEHIHVPGPGEGPGPASGAEPGSGGGPISLNDADLTTLETLPGVGPVIAERIIAHRESNGPFESVDDLLEVPGIGEAKLASIRDLVVP
jgi:competence protein ComEA